MWNIFVKSPSSDLAGLLRVWNRFRRFVEGVEYKSFVCMAEETKFVSAKSLRFVEGVNI